MTSTSTQKHFQWAIEGAATLIVVGVGLNFLVMHTLGSFDAASVILALFLGFWAFVLGNSVLFFSSIWLFMRKREALSDHKIEQPKDGEQQEIGIGRSQLPNPCHAC